MLSRFLVLLALYSSVMLVGNMRFRNDDVRLTGQNARTLVAALQVSIVSAFVFVHSLFMFFISVVKHERTTFVLVSAAGHGEFTIEELDTEAAEQEAQQAARAAESCSDRADARSEQLSVASDPLPLQIVFARSTHLDLYFLYVTFVGLVLWCTFISFNFATYDSNFVVTSGLILGWVGNMLSRECRCHESRTELLPGHKMRVLVYSALALLIMTLGSLSWRVPADMEAAALNFYVPSLCSGVFWTALSHEVAFDGVQNVSRGILYDTRRSLPTFLLVVAVSALCCSQETSERVFDYVGSLSRLAAAHLLLVEPVLIFLSVYVMIIALERQRSTDLGIVLVLVEGVFIAYRRETYDAMVITTITASVLAAALAADQGPKRPGLQRLCAVSARALAGGQYVLPEHMRRLQAPRPTTRQAGRRGHAGHQQVPRQLPTERLGRRLCAACSLRACRVARLASATTFCQRAPRRQVHAVAQDCHESACQRR
jgi:hypothetical protein